MKKKNIFKGVTLVFIITIMLTLTIPNVKGTEQLTSDRIHFISTGDSDAILIESNGHYGLIDTANPSIDNTEEKDQRNHSEYNTATGNGKTVISYFNKIGLESLDFVIGTHNHSDHIGGIPDICAGGNFVNCNTTYIYKPYNEKINTNNSTEASYYNADYYSLAKENMERKGAKTLDITNAPNVNLMQYLPEAKFIDNSIEDVWDCVELNFQNYNIKIFNIYNICDTNENTNSMVILITKGRQKVLLMADMNVINSTEQKIATYIEDVDLVKIGHHGHDGSTSLGMLQLVKPETAVITATDRDLSNGFSVPITYFKENGAAVYKTGDAKNAIVAYINNDFISLYTYDSNGDLSIHPSVISNKAKKGWVTGYYRSDYKIWTYIKSDETFQRGWAKLSYENQDEKWYYFNEDGIMQTGWLNYNNYWYYLNTGGSMHTGWLEDNEKWYYFNESGIMQTGWVRYKGYWFYLNASGEMETGYQTIDGNVYYLAEEKTDFRDIGSLTDSEKYYLNEDGILIKDVVVPSVVTTNESKENWVNSNVVITVKGIDAGTGISNIEYSYNGIEWFSNWEEPLNNDTVAGVWQNERDSVVYIRAIDNAGNISNIEETYIKIDKTEPTITSIEGNPTEWTKENVTITVNASDSSSGLAAEAYSFDGGTTWQEGNTKEYTDNTNNIVIQVRDITGNIAEQKINITTITKLTGIEITTAPKTEYIEGQIFDKTGMVITATYDNGTTEVIEGYTVSPEGALTTEDIKVTISYIVNGVTKTAEVNVTVIKKGDVNGDNEVNFMDILLINKYRLGKTQLERIYIEAADVTGEGEVNFRDILRINKYRLGKINSL